MLLQGLPREQRLMTYSSEHSLFLDDINYQEWESEFLMKPLLRTWEDEVGAARGMDWWFAKVPAATGSLGRETDLLFQCF